MGEYCSQHQETREKIVQLSTELKGLSEKQSNNEKEAKDNIVEIKNDIEEIKKEIGKINEKMAGMPLKIIITTASITSIFTSVIIGIVSFVLKMKGVL